MDTLSGTWDYIMEHRNEVGLLFILITSLIGLVDGHAATRLALVVVLIAWLMNYRPIG